MKRLLATIKNDMTVQVRNNLYAIGIGAALLTALVVALLAAPQHLPGVMPALLLIVTGGSTLLYVAGMILFEKDEGTINAVTVSPLRTAEYLWSKIISLTLLATVESVVIVAGTMLVMRWWSGNPAALTLPNVPLLLFGIVAIGAIYTLIGIIIVVRFDKITDYLIPMAGVAVVLQLPMFYFLGWVVQPWLLAIPTSAPALLMQGAYLPLSSNQWLYAFLYTGLLLAVTAAWAYRAFQQHIILKVG